MAGMAEGGGGGGSSLAGTSSPTEVGIRRRVFRVLWNLECPVGLSQKRKCAHFNEGILVQFGQSAKIKIKFKIITKWL